MYLFNFINVGTYIIVYNLFDFIYCSLTPCSSFISTEVDRKQLFRRQ